MADTVHVDVCPDCGAEFTIALDMPAEVTDEMVERGARALYTKHLETTTYFRDFEEMHESFEAEARIVLTAALPSRETDQPKET